MKFEMKVKMPDLRKLEQELSEKLRKEVEAKIKRVEYLTCPEHHKKGIFLLKGDGGKLSVEIKGCCEKFEKSLQSKLN